MTTSPQHRFSRGTALPLARQQAADLAVTQVDRLDVVLRAALTAVRAIGDRAHDHRYGADVRTLGLEFLPKDYYVTHCVNSLRNALSDPAVDADDVAARLVEVESLLQRILDITATRDLPGHLEVPVELVSRAQTGALAGLGCTTEIRTILLSADPAALRSVAAAGVTSDVPVGRTAGWLTGLAVRLLPAPSRLRYYEEFIGELQMLAAGGEPCRAQFAHAVRLLVTIRALRRSLPGAAVSSTDQGRARRSIALHHPVRRPLFSAQRERYQRWRSRRDGRKLQRVRVRVHRANAERYGGEGHGPAEAADGDSVVDGAKRRPDTP